MTLIFNNSLNINGGGSGGGGGDYTQGPGITIGENNEISVNYDSAQALFTNASTGALGVNVDGTTVVVDGSALKANINDATITITQGGVVKGTFTTNQALANTIALDGGITYTGGKAIEIDQNDAINLKTSIINAPLVYQDETGTDVKFQNRNTERYNGTLGGNGYNDSYWIIDYGTNTTYLNNPDVNFSNLLNSSSTIYAETRLTNGINISGTLSKGLNSTDLAYISLLGRYEQDKSFTVVAAIGLNTFYNVRTYIRFFNNGNDITGLTTSNYEYNSTGDMYGESGAKYYSINCSSTNLVICSMSSIDGNTINASYKNTVTISSQLKNALDTVTHIRVYPVNYNDSNNYVILDESFLKVINPVEDVTAGNGQTRLTTFKNGNNIFEAFPEAIKLKYDSTTLGVNANNELYVLSSTPSNMVTTDTTQTITGQKKFTSNYTYMGNSLVGIGAINGTNGVLTLGLTDVSVANNYNSVLFKNSNGHLVLDLGINNGTKFYVNRRGSTYYTSEVDNFLLEKDMLDGTTITYDSTTGKISTVNPPIATSSTPGIVQPDNSTITVDSNGIISAVNNSIAKTAPIIPLKYEEQEDGISVGIGGTLNHTNYTSSVDQVYVANDASSTGIYNMSGDGYIYQSVTNMMSKIFYKGYKIRLDNGLNIAWNVAEDSGFFMNVAVGYYNNGNFVPVLYALNTNSYGGQMFARPALEFGTDVYDMGRLTTQFESCIGISLVGDVLSAFGPRAGRNAYTISDTALLTEFQKCTHAICTVINESTTGTNFNYSTSKFANPETSLSTGSTDRDTIFSEAENLILNTDTTVVPELKLNYDSNTLGVNSSNELTVPTATTSNLGLVQPDGSTITVDSNGVISAASGGSTLQADDYNIKLIGSNSDTITTNNNPGVIISTEAPANYTQQGFGTGDELNNTTHIFTKATSGSYLQYTGTSTSPTGNNEVKKNLYISCVGKLTQVNTDNEPESQWNNYESRPQVSRFVNHRYNGERNFVFGLQRYPVSGTVTGANVVYEYNTLNDGNWAEQITRIVGNTVISLNTTHRFEVYHDITNNTVSLFIDGVLDKTVENTPTPQNMYITNGYYSGRPQIGSQFVGEIDLAYYDIVADGYRIEDVYSYTEDYSNTPTITPVNFGLAKYDPEYLCLNTQKQLRIRQDVIDKYKPIQYASGYSIVGEVSEGGM